MKKLLMGFIMVAVLSVASNASSNWACGFKPFKPLGCQNGYAQCICDERGQNCRWQWICS